MQRRVIRSIVISWHDRLGHAELTSGRFDGSASTPQPSGNGRMVCFDQEHDQYVGKAETPNEAVQSVVRGGFCRVQSMVW